MSRVVIIGDIYYADLYPGNALPGGGGYPSQPIHHPGHPDHGLPSQPGHPGNRPPGSWGGPVDPGWGQGGMPHPGGGPIYHPGHPDHGLPSQPGHPGNRPPGSGRPPRPDNSLPISDRIDNALPDGEEIEIDNELPEVPAEYADKVIVAVKKPNEEWVVKAYDDVSPDNELPETPEPK
jgi:hypothetical protein